jgi:2-oxoglutarate ferredoxin oxidoreductase subunit gamma
MVTISDKWIASPFVESADTAIFMNEPSVKKFLKRLNPQGVLILNSSLIRKDSCPQTFKPYAYPFTDIASRIGDIRVANTVALGLYIRVKKIIKPESAPFAVKKSFKESILNVNLKALEEGLSLL